MDSNFNSDVWLSSEGDEEWLTSKDENGKERDVGADSHFENDDPDHVRDESGSEDERSVEDIEAAVRNQHQRRYFPPTNAHGTAV
jgi:hypothetical protein